MAVTLSLDKMSVEEKLQIMETVWDDLRSHAADVVSPAWHEQVLRERAEAYEAGTMQLIDWESAKKFIDERTS
jgi:putative addiction module component (TIGR02574 family)